MSSDFEIRSAISELLTGILRNYDARVPQEGAFDDLRVKQQVAFSDPSTSGPGVLELTVMAMDETINHANRTLRFLAVRVKKSPRGGTVSSTAFHGDKDHLRADLEREQKEPKILMEIVQELLFGLPEETNPDAWR